MISQQLILQCDVYRVLRVFTYQTNRNISRMKSDMKKRMQGVIYISNKSQYLKNDMKNYRWSSFIISRVLSNKTNLIFISCTL